MNNISSKILLVISVLFTGDAYACQCGSDGLSAIEAYNEYTHIFTARIVSAELIQPDTEEFSIGAGFAISPVTEILKADFIVQEVFKGNPERVLNLYGLPLGNSCGLTLYVGGTFLVYANGETVNVSVCSRTRWVDNLKPLESVLKDREEIEWLRLESVRKE